MEFKQLLAAGDRDLTYHVIKWVLSQGQVLEKRAFVGFYLSFPEVSTVLMSVSAVVGLKWLTLVESTAGCSVI